MTRESLEQFLSTLPEANDKYLAVDVDIVELRERAILVETMTGIHTKKTWIPKSQVASLDRGRTFGHGLAVKRSWVAMQKLWFMV